MNDLSNKEETKVQEQPEQRLKQDGLELGTFLLKAAKKGRRKSRKKSPKSPKSPRRKKEKSFLRQLDIKPVEIEKEKVSVPKDTDGNYMFKKQSINFSIPVFENEKLSISKYDSKDVNLQQRNPVMTYIPNGYIYIRGNFSSNGDNFLFDMKKGIFTCIDSKIHFQQTKPPKADYAFFNKYKNAVVLSDGSPTFWLLKDPCGENLQWTSTKILVQPFYPHFQQYHLQNAAFLYSSDRFHPKDVLFMFGGKAGNELSNNLYGYQFPAIALKEKVEEIVIEQHLRPPPRSHAQMVCCSNHLMIYGGKDANGEFLNDLWKLHCNFSVLFPLHRYNQNQNNQNNPPPSSWVQIEFGDSIPRNLSGFGMVAPRPSSKFFYIYGGEIDGESQKMFSRFRHEEENSQFEIVVPYGLSHPLTSRPDDYLVKNSSFALCSLEDDAFAVFGGVTRNEKWKPELLVFKGTNFEGKPSEISPHMQRLFNQKEYSDCSIATFDEFIDAHRCVLAARSPKFQDMLMELENQGYDDIVIDLSDFEGKIVRYYLEFLYTGELNIPSQDCDLFGKILEIAKMFGHFDHLEEIFYGTVDLSLKENIREVYLNNFISLLKKGHFSDCKIHLSLNGSVVSAHLPIICRIEVFKASFQMNMLESITGVLELDDVDETSIRIVLEYLYSGRINILPESCVGVYIVAVKFCIKDLLIFTQNFIRSLMTPMDVVDLLAIFDQYDDLLMVSSVISYMSQNFDVVSLQPNYTSVKSEHKEKIEKLAQSYAKKMEKRKKREHLARVSYSRVGH